MNISRKTLLTGLGVVLATLLGTKAGLTQPLNTVGVPDFNKLYADRPTQDVSPYFVESAGLMRMQNTGTPAYEYHIHSSYTPNDQGSATFDPSISKMQLDSDAPGRPFFGIFQLIDGQSFSIVKDFATGDYWLHGKIDGEYRAAVCKKYDNASGLVSQCKGASPRITEDRVTAAADLSRGLGQNLTDFANKMNGFNPPPTQKPQEKEAYIAKQRRNYYQLIPTAQ